jgi:hypothetical protein
LLVVGPERNGSWPIGYATGNFNDGDWKFTAEDPAHTRVVAWLEGTVSSNHELYNVSKDQIRFS